MMYDIILDFLVVILILTNIHISIVARRLRKHEKSLAKYKTCELESELLNDIISSHQK